MVVAFAATNSAVGTTAAAQAVGTGHPLRFADRGPVFYAAPAADAPRRDARGAAVFHREIALDLVGATIPDALDAIRRAAQVQLVYTADILPHDARISLQATRISLSAALTAVLMDAGVDVWLSDAGLLSIVARSGRAGAVAVGAKRQMTGTIVGRVMDASTSQPLAQATIAVAGTALGATVRLDGTYQIHGVVPGTYRVTARRLGYSVGTRVVTVADTGTAVADFALTPSAAVLEQVVTTVTGDEKRYRVGNLIETMHADSVVKAAPATDLGDLLTARVPGLQVFEPGGVTGASPQINIRGQNSLTVSNQPLLIIDGVRAENSPAAQSYGTAANPINGASLANAFSGRLNDLNPEEIENIEVVKGPSAATLYGTDAANGVIIVTTKRGTVGAPRWDFSAEAGALTMDKNRFLLGYKAWGHTTDGSNTPERCLLIMKAAGTCVIDSVTHFSPLRDPATTIVNTGYRQQYGAQVSGGAHETRYFASGTYDEEVAPIKMPTADLAILRAERGAVGLEPDNVRPNALTKGSGRLNLTTAVGPTTELAVSSGLLTQASRIPSPYVWDFGQGEVPGYRDASDGWGFGLRPAAFFAIRNREDVTHATASVNATWHPTGWLLGRATTGVDYSSDYIDVLARPNEGFGQFSQRQNGRVNIALYTVDLGATATTSLWDLLSSKTSIGAQYNHRSELDNAASGSQLAPGSVSVAGAAVQTTTEVNLGTIVTGGYVEETLGLNDRLFVTGGLRADGGSAFGQSFKTAAYPKASMSWLVSQEPWVPRIPGVSSLRLRAAYGASGVQPGPADALATVTLAPASVDGGTMSGGILGALGNPHLKPEKQTEFEGGADLEAMDRRVQLGVTYYNKKSTDALINVPLPTLLGTGGGTQEINVGSVRNVGYEISASVELVRSRVIDWSVGVNGSNNQNRLVKLAPGMANLGFGNFSSFVAGYPLYSNFDFPILGYKDLNGDGVIQPNEVTVGPTPVYLGGHYPTAQITYQTTMGLWAERVQLHVQADSRSGITLADENKGYAAIWRFDRAQNDPTATFREQAATQAELSTGSLAGFVENGSFTRLREVALTYNAPPTLTRLFRGRSASLTLAGRNLAVWTRYSGADPEVNHIPPTALGGIRGAAFRDVGAAPMAKYWIARVRVGL